MLRKLVREADVYECACLLVLDAPGGHIQEEDDGEARGADDEPAALVPMVEGAGEEATERRTWVWCRRLLRYRSRLHCRTIASRTTSALTGSSKP